MFPLLQNIPFLIKNTVYSRQGAASVITKRPEGRELPVLFVSPWDDAASIPPSRSSRCADLPKLRKQVAEFLTARCSPHKWAWIKMRQLKGCVSIVGADEWASAFAASLQLHQSQSPSARSRDRLLRAEPGNGGRRRFHRGVGQSALRKWWFQRGSSKNTLFK